MKSPLVTVAKRALRKANLAVVRIDSDVHSAASLPEYSLRRDLSISQLKAMTLNYLRSLRLTQGGRFVGYRYSSTRQAPILYGTIAALLTKHLYGEFDEGVEDELKFLQDAQSPDGLFRDPVVSCPEADTEDWWGWRHLTLLALMTLALYDRPAKHRISYIEPFLERNHLSEYLKSKDWGARVDFTSNELQNIGVMMQYARDYQGNDRAGSAMSFMIDYIERKQDPRTGLFGIVFENAEDISRGVQAGYHFWLLNEYDRRPIQYRDQVIDSVLKTQNILGGYGLKLNSSACDDIDSIDPLIRIVTQGDSLRESQVQASLKVAFSACLHNLNSDGGWVFRRHEAWCYGYSPNMFSGRNESNIFFTWFRTLALAYILEGLSVVPQGFDYSWNWGRAPGHQFL